jgi:glycosyltransferase involved in cell wall biosynthesis
MNQLVSVIIPAFNAGKYLKECVNSVLNQTYPNIEIIIIDDGSTDGSTDFLKVSSCLPPNLKLFSQSNKGACAARNLGIRKSKGEYIQFLDADDILSPDKIKNQMELLIGKSSQVVTLCEWVIFHYDFKIIDRLTYEVFCNSPSGLDWLLRAWNNQEMIQPAAWLTHKRLILKAGDWNENLTINQDGEFFCRVLLNCKEVIFESKSKVYYRSPSAGNISRNKSRKSIESLLASYQSYEFEALRSEDSYRVRLALKKVYQKFIYDIFPRYPDLVKEAERLILNLNVDEKTYIGGPKFQRLSKLIGFKNAIRLKRLLQE